MQTFTVTCEDPPLSVTVRAATPLMELHRSLRMSQGLAQLAAGLGMRCGEPFPEGFERTSEALMAQSTWPNCIACVIKSEGFDHLTLTLSEFAALPERFVATWAHAALELNPHWRHVRPTRLCDLMKPTPTEGETNAS